MNRRDFLFNAVSGLFLACQPKIFIDLAANTWRYPKLEVLMDYFDYGCSVRYSVAYGDFRYGLISAAPMTSSLEKAIAETLVEGCNRCIRHHGYSYPKLTEHHIFSAFKQSNVIDY